MQINWLSDESHILSNPRWGEWKKTKIQEYSDQLLAKPAMIWLSTSGSSSEQGVLKLIALSKKSILASAAAVNEHIQSTKQDVWLKVLPSFHIGGLSILARAYLSGAKVYESSEFAWSAKNLLQELSQSQASLVSLVPTQVYDLVRANQVCPKSVRVVFVGGGRLNDELYKRAIQLNWPVVLTYGMTEASSQIATSRIHDVYSADRPKAKILPHIDVQIAKNGLISVKGISLLSYKASIENTKISIEKIDTDNYFETEDLGELLEGEFLQVLGRHSDVVKVLGELVNVSRLNTLLSGCQGVICALPDRRCENKIVYVCELEELASAGAMLAELNCKVMPFERVTEVYFIKKIPKTELNKIKINIMKAYL